MDTRTYTELARYDSLEDRFEYLKLGANVGDTTFGSDRWINQQFYRSKEWKRIRNHVIVRDNGLDLGAFDSPLRGYPVIHHMNPLRLSDIEDATENLLDPEFLITTCHKTHNAIHYGDKKLLPQPFVERRPNDTIPWR